MRQLEDRDLNASLVNTAHVTRRRSPPGHQEKPMTTESLTYADLAGQLGTTQEAARSLVRRLRLPRMKGNDGKARVNVDLNDFQYKPMPTRKRDNHQADTVEALQAELARIEVEKRCLEATAAGHRADFERERDRAESALAEAIKMTGIAISARETAARLEGELLARRRSWWRRRPASNGGDQNEAALGAISRSAQTQPEATTIRRRLPLGRTLMLELIALTLVAAVAFLFVQHGVPYLAEP
jgi:hypothetical protein